MPGEQGERQLQGAREVGVLVSTIVSLIAPIALDFGINGPCLLFSPGINLLPVVRPLPSSLFLALSPPFLNATQSLS